MTNLFLKVNKDLFKLGLNPTEILIMAQVMEYNNNTGNCYISNDTLASMFAVSAKTISRAIKNLEDKGLLTRDTKNIKGGKERHMVVNIQKLEELLTKDNLSLVENDIEDSQRTICPLSKDNLSLDNGQNDFIKDNSNEKDNEKDNKGEVSSPSGEETSLPEGKQVGEIKAYELSQIDTCNYTYVEDDVIQVLQTGKLLRVIGGKAVSASA